MKVEIKLDEKCEETTVTITTKEVTDEINELLNRLSNQYPTVITGFCENNAVIVEVDKIIRIYASNQKVFIVTDDHECTSRLRLYQLEERLPGNSFIRISNSEIVNLKKIKDFDLSFAGSISVRFLNGSTTYVSRRYIAKLKNILGL